MHAVPGRGIVAVLCLSIAVYGCATTRVSFRDFRAKMNDANVCRAGFDAAAANDAEFLREVADELTKRGIHPSRCKTIVEQANANLAAGVGAVLAVAAVVAVARSGGGGGGGYASPAASSGVTDYEWDWDYQNGQFGPPVWVCRGVQTGQYADFYRCNGKLKVDLRWPGLGTN